MQAMILAAGFGTRLLPYTLSKPKPLFPVLNIPLLELTINNLREAGFGRIVVNSHYLRDQICAMTKTLPDIILQEESTILGTGGGLRLALENFSNEPILVTNGDIYHSVNLRDFYLEHIQSGAKVTLAVHDYQRFNSLMFEGTKLKSFDGSGKSGSLAFTGLHVVDPEVLKPIALGKNSSIIDRYSEVLQQGDDIKVVRIDGKFWTDMGTPTDYLDLHGMLLLGKVPCCKMLAPLTENKVLISKNAELGRNVEFQDWACVGASIIEDNVKIQRSVIWDGAHIPPNSVITDAIIR